MDWLAWKAPASYTDKIYKKVAVEPLAHSEGFEHITATISELIAIWQHGFAIAPQFRGGIRKKENFLRSGYITADIDSGRTLEDAFADPFIQRCATAIYTTASHTSEQHRFRIVCILEQPNTDAEVHALLQRQFARRVGGDLAATDAARMSYGNDNAQVSLIGGGIDNALAAELLEQAQTLKAEARSRPRLDGPVLPGDLLVRPKYGPPSFVADLPSGTAIHCPWHDDSDPSAFVLENSKRTAIGIHCMSCNRTEWMKPKPLFDFYDFETMVLEAHAGK